MTYPSDLTLSNLNLKDLNSVIKWTPYFAQALAAVRFLAMENATATRDYNNADSLASAPPFLKGATLPKTPVNTTVVSEPFQRFGDISILDYSDIQNARGVNQLEQQTRSIEARILRELSKQFFEGNGTAPNLKGITSRSDTTINAGAAALTLALLFQLRYSVKPSTAQGLGYGANAWFSHPTAFRKVLSLLGTDVSALSWVHNEKMGVSVPHFLGAEWFLDENITVTSNITEIYAVNLEHVWIWYAKNNEYPSNAFGIQHIPVPLQDDISEMGTLVTGVYAIENNPGAIAKITNVNVA